MARRRAQNGDPEARSTAYVVPPVRELKRERKALLLVREERLRDLGGLTLEMYKRDRFNAGLVVERCAELVAIEARVQEIDALLDGTVSLHAGGGAVCACGAPLLLGARFCATCGRPVGVARPVEDDETDDE
jgi:transposase